MIKIASFQFNLFGVNTYVVWDDITRDAAIIDPGMSSPEEESELTGYISDNNLTVKHLINTHLHIDHTLGNDFVTGRYGLGTEAATADAPLGENRAAQARMFHLRIPEPRPLAIATPLHDGDIISVGTGKLRVISVPGHSPGSIALYCDDTVPGFVITGDALFDGSIGRTDLPGGNHRQLIESITRHLLTLPADTVVYPGHGGTTTIGNEMRYNPFLR